MIFIMFHYIIEIKMKTTASELIESCLRDLIVFPSPVYADYSFTKDELRIVFGIYQGFIKQSFKEMKFVVCSYK